MSKYITKRVLMSILTLMVILFVLFLMLSYMPGSPFNDEKLTAVQKQVLYAKYGLDQPFFVRFAKYVVNMFKGDLGVSYVLNKNRAVADMIKGPLMVSIRIGAQGFVVGSIIGLLLGIAAALNHNTWIDSLCSVVSVLGVSVPSYVFALLLAFYIDFPSCFKKHNDSYCYDYGTIVNQPADRIHGSRKSICHSWYWYADGTGHSE